MVPTALSARPTAARRDSDDARASLLSRIRWVPVATFVATTVAFCFLPLLGMRTMAAVDLGEGGSPYRDDLGRAPHIENPLQVDQLDTAPRAESFFRQLRSGSFQLWSHDVAAGTPSGILPFHAFLSPTSVGYLVAPAWYAIGLRIALALLCAQAFTYLLLRRLGASVLAATLAGVAFAFCGANLVLLLRMMAPLVVPACLWAGHHLVDRPGIRTAALTAVMLAWTWFEGFPVAFLYALYVTAAWVVWLAVARYVSARGEDGREAVRQLGRVVLWGVAAAVWTGALMLVSAVPLAVELADRGTLGTRAATGHLPPVQFFGIYLDRALGGSWAEGRYWSGLNPVESANQVGLVVMTGAAVALALAASGRVRLTLAGRAAWSFMCVLGVWAVTVCYLGGPVFTLTALVPGLGTNPINRIRFVIDLAFVTVAALGLDSMLQRRRGGTDLPGALVAGGAEHERRPFGVAGRALSGATLVFLAAVTAVLLPDLWQGITAAGQRRETAAAFAVALALTAACALVVLVVARRPGTWWLAWAGIATALYLQLAVPFASFTPASPVRNFFTEQEAHHWLRDALADRHRFAASGLLTFAPSSSAATGVADLRGITVPPVGLTALLEAVTPRAFERDKFKPVLSGQEWNLGSPLLDDLAVGYFAVGTNEMPLGRVLHVDDTAEAWTRPEALTASARTFPAPGPLQGIAVPLRIGGGGCDAATVSITLSTPAGVVDTTQRPGFDIAGEWTYFAATGDDLRPGEPVTVEIGADRDECGLEVGTVTDAASGAVRLAHHLILPDPEQGVRVAETSQGWIYRRPGAWDLVSAHDRWRRFDDRAEMLRYAASRPPEDDDVVAILAPREDVPAMPPGGGSATVSGLARGDSSWDFRVEAPATNAVVVSQVESRGWRVLVDGQETQTVSVDGALLGFFVTAGSHDVSVRYEPTHFFAPAAVSALAFAGVLAVAVTAVLDRRRRPRRERTAGGEVDAAGDVAQE